MTIVRRRIALIAGTMLLAGAASSGVAMASTPPVVHTAVQASVQYGGHGGHGHGRGHGEHGHGRGHDFRGHGHGHDFRGHGHGHDFRGHGDHGHGRY
ncbi:hypothetical protein [Streptomyces sp. NPDC001020]